MASSFHFSPILADPFFSVIYCMALLKIEKIFPLERNGIGAFFYGKLRAFCFFVSIFSKYRQ